MDIWGPFNIAGALLGLTLCIGLWLVASGLRKQHPHLAERISPFVQPMGEIPPPTRELRVTPGKIAIQLAKPLVAVVAQKLHHVIGGSTPLHQRLQAAGGNHSVDAFRIQQVTWGLVGSIGSIGCVALLASIHRMNLLGAASLVITGFLAGFQARDWTLSLVLRRREAAILTEFPVVAELLALAVAAGESPVGALERISRICRGELPQEIETALTETRMGVPLATALAGIAQRTHVDILARFAEGIIVALERGTPIVDVLHAQAADVRESAKRALIVSAGRKELAMMVPVVFLILPITVLFALYPGLINITVLTG